MYKSLIVAILLCVATTAYGIDCKYKGLALCSDVAEVINNQQKILLNQEKIKKGLQLLITNSHTNYSIEAEK